MINKYVLSTSSADIKSNPNAHLYNKTIIILEKILCKYNLYFYIDCYDVILSINQYNLEYLLTPKKNIIQKNKIIINIYKKNNQYEVSLNLELYNISIKPLLFFFIFDDNFNIQTIEKYIFKNKIDNVAIHNGILYKKCINKIKNYYTYNYYRQPIVYYTKNYIKSHSITIETIDNYNYVINKYYNKKHMKITEHLFLNNNTKEYYSNIYLFKYDNKICKIGKHKVANNNNFNCNYYNFYLINKQFINNNLTNFNNYLLHNLIIT